MATTVYGDYTFDTSTGGSSAGINDVFILPAATLAAATGTLARITVEYAGFASGATSIMYFGQAAASGDAFDFNGNQVSVPFSGSGTLTGNGSTFVWVSDWFTLGESYDETKNYNLCIRNGGSAGSLNFRYLNSPGVTGADFLFKGAAEDPSITDKSGYTSALSGKAIFLRKLEIDVASSGITYPQLERGIRGLHRGVAGGSYH